MRLSSGLVALAVVASTVVISAGPVEACEQSSGGGSAECGMEEEGTPPGRGSGGVDDGTTGGSGSGSADEHVLYWPVFGTDPATGEPCLAWEARDLGRPPGPEERSGAESLYRGYRDLDYADCPGAGPPPTTTPGQQARAFFESVPLPVPAPRIQPGRMLVGLRAYLETGAPVTETFGPEHTPFGPLSLTAGAEIYVDWDDPHDSVDGEEGPFTEPGGPHPDGGISHVYTRAGSYDITVRQVWVADWRIGDVTGTIDTGLETTGEVLDFEVSERQAVVHHHDSWG